MKIVGCFLEYDGKFVILLRHSHKPRGGTWGLPAGKVEPGEDEKTALLRELYEETGYRGSERELEHLGDFTFGTGKHAYQFLCYRIKLSHSFDIVLEESAHADFLWVSGQECYARNDLIEDLHSLLEKLDLNKPSNK